MLSYRARLLPANSADIREVHVSLFYPCDLWIATAVGSPSHRSTSWLWPFCVGRPEKRSQTMFHLCGRRPCGEPGSTSLPVGCPFAYAGWICDRVYSGRRWKAAIRSSPPAQPTTLGGRRTTIIRQTRRGMIAPSRAAYIFVQVDCSRAQAFSELARDGTKIPQPTTPRQPIVRNLVADMT